MTKHWISLALSFVAFTVVLLVRGPDTLALVEVMFLCVTTAISLAVADDIEKLKFYKNEYIHWQDRAQRVERAVRDFIKLERELD
jgi:hypothetical protein